MGTTKAERRFLGGAFGSEWYLEPDGTVVCVDPDGSEYGSDFQYDWNGKVQGWLKRRGVTWEGP